MYNYINKILITNTKGDCIIAHGRYCDTKCAKITNMKGDCIYNYGTFFFFRYWEIKINVVYNSFDCCIQGYINHCLEYNNNSLVPINSKPKHLCKACTLPRPSLDGMGKSVVLQRLQPVNEGLARVFIFLLPLLEHPQALLPGTDRLVAWE